MRPKRRKTPTTASAPWQVRLDRSRDASQAGPARLETKPRTREVSGCRHARRSRQATQVQCGRMTWRDASTRSIEHLSKVEALA